MKIDLLTIVICIVEHSLCFANFDNNFLFLSKDKIKRKT